MDDSQIKSGGLIVGWHLANGQNFLLHNARLGKGFTLSASSLVIEGQAAVTPYQMFHRDAEKEALWEQVRKNHFPDPPSRMGAFFMFEAKEDAERAKATWFKTEDRTLVEVWAVNPAFTKAHKADAAWLEQPRNNWADAAHKYWRGDVSGTPKIEIIVHGQLYFPAWETFALFGGLSITAQAS